MSVAFTRVRALIRKEWQDLLRNAQVLIMIFMPVPMAILFQFIGTTEGEGILFLQLMPLLMAFTMSGTFVQSMIIAEEKEKHTLRILMLSPASATEVLLGKTCLSLMMTVLSTVLCIFISGASIATSFSFWIMAMLNIVIFVILGTIVGLLAKSLAETSYIGLPLSFLFFFGAIFPPMMDVDWLVTITNPLPTNQFILGVEALDQGLRLADVGQHVLIMGGWLVALILICLFIYRRNQLER